MIQAFLDYISIEKKYSPATVQAYRDDLRDFCLFLGWDTTEYNPAKVSDADVREWLVVMMDESHNSARSVRRRLSALHSFYRFLLRIGKVKVDITRKVIAPKIDKPLPVFFKPSEMAEATRWEEEADDFESIRDCLIIQMLYQTGMRQAEMLNLKDEDIRSDAAEIRIFGKRRKERIVPIGESLLAEINKYLNARNEIQEKSGSFGTFFVHRDKSGRVTSLTKSILYRIVRSRMGEVSTLKKHSPHVLRHTFATTMLDNGADIRTIQQLLGHASLAATQVYTHTTFEQIQKTYNAAHPRAKK
ncbi:MAG: tyrosine-type recombinase/integrase [Bacteroidales bacterium]|nr:tyrosine-type recombinase/integrase [Candidatus Colicola caccequi]MCQ2328549.1 tyrosine-type recombinase/integrase [Paludibacteraceae bacterium]